MEKVLIVGAGAQGGPCAAILAGEEQVKEVRLGDIQEEYLQKVTRRIKSHKLVPLKIDAGNINDLIRAAEGVDTILNFTLIQYNEQLMQAALACNAHYVDTACNLEFLDRWISGETPKFHDEFVKQGKTALVGCGFSPGVANVITRYICDQLETIERIIIRVGRSSPTDTGEVVSAWEPSWSPEVLLEDYADPPMLLKEGKYIDAPIFSNPEVYTFPEPVGEILLSSHNHEEPYLLPRFYKEKGLQEVDFKYPVDKLAGAFVKMGFAGDHPINVKGVEVVPRDVLMHLVKRPGNSFLEESERSTPQGDLTGIMEISVDGSHEGEKITHLVSYVFTNGKDEKLKRQLIKTYGTAHVYVALPAVVGAKLVSRGDLEPGVITPDSIVPWSFFTGMAERGVPFKMEERVIKRTAI
ncbi:MAG: saccharopine dehydrogenase NADP-binding domain-containing protein [Chloroflexota bacterium]|nr:MAG: saccharopine dehydrogenase NADP-binding domain-containing protein [Chloroflexota bacterium]